MATEAEINEAFDAGVASAKALLAESSNPVLMVDELCDDELSTANAKGWNSVWASPENSRRWQAYRNSKGQGLEQAIESPESLAEKIVSLMVGDDDKRI
ncbi:hypothetical protein M5G27_29530 [Pseudomonas shahriarae]|uniref:Uncharacterized protein n=1 Tax=Pseudomonas shahriarae TaxID=2745512 RepID=A0A9X4C7K0_9PSED|nr:hypothetical protein [Pseudomonas shahriarae]MDD1011605.1 hypothetical protein [Pseudomonas shahriarae]